MNFNKKETANKVKKLVSKSNKYKRKLSIWLFRLGLLLVIAITVCCASSLFGAFKGILASTPDITPADVQPNGFSSIIYDQENHAIQKLSDYESNREEISLDEIPKNLQNAFIAIEDSRFYEHNGIDIKGILRAGLQGITSGSFSQGASTLTQQLLKNNVFGVGGETNFMDKLERKLQEQYLAIELEKQMSKEDILEAYLNTINLGEGTLGVEAASKTYFDKKAMELNLSECAVIASITQNPTQYNPIHYPEANAKRRNTVLQYMLEADMITQAEYDQAIADDVYSRISEVQNKKSSSSSYSYFIDAVIKEVVSDLQEQLGYNETQAYNALYSDGLQIFSTQDSNIQKICDQEVNNTDNYLQAGFTSTYALSYQLSISNAQGETIHYSEADIAKQQGYTSSDLMSFATKKEGKKAIKTFKKATLTDTDTILGENYTFTIEPQISLTIIDQETGYVKALVGGRGNKSGNLTLNRCTDTTKQPGSTFKVLSTFVPALDTSGITLGSVYDDCPYNYENSTKAVNNYYTGFRGLSTVREAIRDSMNIVTAKCIAQVTPQVGYDYLLKMGFTTLVEKQTDENGTIYSDIQQSLCLGGITNGVTNIELTAAYAAIANLGAYNKPILYTQIIDHNGNVLIDNTSKSTQVMKASTAWLLTNAMRDVVTSGTATACQLANNIPAAGKTGTTSNDFDHWFVGFTPYYTGGIWCGYDANRSFLTGGVEKTIWANVMNRINQFEQNTETDFPACEDITTCRICKKCGKRAVNGLCDADPRGSMIIKEYYAAGTKPTEKCNCHTKLNICVESGLPASDYCPSTSIMTKVYIKRPKGSQGTTDDSPYTLPAYFGNSVCTLHTEASLNPAPEATEPVAPETPASETLPANPDTPPSDANNMAPAAP